MEEVIDHPQIEARKALQTIDTPYGQLRFMGNGFQLAHGGGKLDRMGPLLGADNDAILAEAGYSKDEVKALRDSAVI